MVVTVSKLILKNFLKKDNLQSTMVKVHKLSVTQNTFPLVQELTDMFMIFPIDKIYPLKTREHNMTRIGDIVEIKMLDGRYKIVNKVMIDTFGIRIKDKCQEICRVIKDNYRLNPKWNPKIVSIAILEKTDLSQN